MVRKAARPVPAGKVPELVKNSILYLVVAFFGLLIFLSFLNPGKSEKTVPFSQAVKLARDGQLAKVEVEGEMLTLTTKTGEKLSSRKEIGESFEKTLRDSGVDLNSLELDVKSSEMATGMVDLLVNILPVILMIVFFYFIFRQARGAGDSLFSFGKSRAKLFVKEVAAKITFKDVAGVDTAKKELQEVVEFLKEPEKFRKLGARTPKGVLLVGPAGVGKTLLARALAGEANVPFFSMAGSEFMEMLVGVGASRVRDLFETAKKNVPAIIFIDEIESIGRQRGMGMSGGHDEREQTLNQILVEMDGFTPNLAVLVVAATNRPDLLDPALVRPGRFDRRVVLDLPDMEGRIDILKIHMRNKPIAEGVNMDKLSRRTVGFSGADLENMLNEAAILAARESKKVIEEPDLEEAATKVKLGPERRRLQSDRDKSMTAYHEAGHAIVAASLPEMDPVHRISIVARGMALGFTMIPPLTDRYNETKTRLLENITALLGGRAAEELVFNELTVGAGSDIAQATDIARKMVTEYGMSELGPIFMPDGGSGFWAMVPTEEGSHSENMAAQIDQEIKKIIDLCHARAGNILADLRGKLDAVAKALIERETLEGDEFLKLLEPENPSVQPPIAPQPSAQSSVTA